MPSQPQGSQFWTRYKVAAESVACPNAVMSTEVTGFLMGRDEATNVALDKVAFLAKCANVPWNPLNLTIVLLKCPVT